MTLTVLTAVLGEREAPLVAGLEHAMSGVTVVRRCADVLDLLSAAAAGLARAALVSGDLDKLDRDVVARLRLSGLAVVGLAAPGDPPLGSERLNRMGIDLVLPTDAPVEEIIAALTTAVTELPVTPAAASVADPGLGDPAGALSRLAGVGPTTGARQMPRPSGRIIAVWGPVGAPGRTTVAVTLASQLARAGQETLLVDADTHGACVAQSLGLLDESAGIAAAARAANQAGLDLPRLAELAPPVSTRLRVLTGLPQSRRWPELRASALEVVWERARGLAAWTVVDAGFGLETDEEIMFDTAAPRRHAATLSSIAAADVVLVVGGAEPIALQRLIAMMPQITDVAGPRQLRVVVTRVRDGAVGRGAGRLITDALRRYAGVERVLLVPDDRSALDAAMLRGVSLTEQAPQSPACRPFEELAEELVGEHGPVRSDTGGGRRAARRRRRSA